MTKENKTITAITIPFTTWLGVVAIAALIYCGILLWPLMLLVAISLLIAVTLNPVLQKLCTWGVPKSVGVGLIALTISALMIVIVVTVVPSLADQLSALVKDVPGWRDELFHRIPEGAFRRTVMRFVDKTEVSAGHVVLVGQAVGSATVEFFLVLILAIYFLADGHRTWEWLLAFFPKAQQTRLRETGEEVSTLVFAYMGGQLITSFLCSVFVFVVLSLLKVPAALVLALLAGIFDILPILGFFIFSIPAVLLSLTVSGKTALTVVALYVGYHLLENYLLVPKIYGKRLRLSDLVVLLSVLVGGLLAGIPGAILILPVVAAYPPIERIWLKRMVGEKVVAKHKKVEDSEP